MRPQWEKLILFVISDKYLLLDKRYSFLDNFTIFLRFYENCRKTIENLKGTFYQNSTNFHR